MAESGEATDCADSTDEKWMKDDGRGLKAERNRGFFSLAFSVSVKSVQSVA